MKIGGLRVNGVKKISKPNEPLITIITVVYNGVETIKQTINSIINQKYKNIEYIIIDGDSKDGTIDIIKQYDNNIDYWLSEPDKGIYDAMNKGFSQANGEWICFMNSGDYFYSDSIFNQLQSFLFKGDLIYTNAINNENNIIKQYTPTLLNFMLERMICHQTILANKKCFQNNLFDTNYKIIADRKWFYNVYRNKNKILHVDVVSTVYDENGISQNRTNFDSESKRLQKELFGYIGILIYNLKRIFNKK